MQERRYLCRDRWTMGGMKDRWDTGQVGCRTGDMQDGKDQEWRDAGKER